MNNQYWIIPGSRNNALVLLSDSTLYVGSPPDLEQRKLRMATVNPSELKSMLSIPFSYIKEISNQKGQPTMTITFGSDSKEELSIENEITKNAIFNALRLELPNFSYQSEIPSAFDYNKRLLITIFIMGALFLTSLYLAIKMEAGIDYSNGPFTRGILLALWFVVFSFANLGVTKLLLCFTAIFGFLGFRYKRRLETRSEIQTLKR